MKNLSRVSRSTRLAIGAAAVGVLGAGTVGTFAAAADAADTAPAKAPAAAARADAGGSQIRQSTHLTEAAALRAAQASLDAAEKAGQHVSVAVVDRDGRVIVELRGDGSGPQAFESAEKKGYTAVAWNAPTSELAKRLEKAPTLEDIPGTLFLAGGAPVTANGAPIAGIGVAGAPSGDLDESFAQAGVAALSK